MTIQYKPKTGARGVEWCDRTENPISGCVHECQWKMPDGTVAVCYAKGIAESGVAKLAYPEGFAHHYWNPDRLKALVAGDEPQLIFCDSMSDLFAANVPEEHVTAVLDAMRKAPHHTYQSLTKAAPQILKYIDRLPPNLWVGVSSPPDWMLGHKLDRSQQVKMLERSLSVLQHVKNKTGNIVWMSAEPLSWGLARVIRANHPLDWIVIGAASHGRKTFQPNTDDVRDLLIKMDYTKTPVFFKGNLSPTFANVDLGLPELNRWREDFPTRCHCNVIPAVEARQKRCRELGWPESELPR